MLLPSAIIFINNNITNNQQLYLQNQLQITETIYFQEFNARINKDPNYPQIIHSQNLRVLVILQNMQDTTNRELADVVFFVKQGLIAILKNKFGPLTTSFSQNRINLWQLLRAANSNQVLILPEPQPKPIYPCQQLLPYGLGGIFAIELQASTLSICPNPDNERNNQAFINRK